MYALYSDHYVIDLPTNHGFPIEKYRLIRERLLAEGALRPEELIEPTLADPRDICLVHTGEYWASLSAGTLPADAIRRLGFPWSESLVRRSRASVQGTLTAARIAIREAVGVNLAGVEIILNLKQQLAKLQAENELLTKMLRKSVQQKSEVPRYHAIVRVESSSIRAVDEE